MYQLAKINPYCLSELFVRSDGNEALDKSFLELTKIILLDNFILSKGENIFEALNISFLSMFHPTE